MSTRPAVGESTVRGIVLLALSYESLCQGPTLQIDVPGMALPQWDSSDCAVGLSWQCNFSAGLTESMDKKLEL